MLDELREALEPGMMPNEELFKIYMEKSLAEDRIQVLLNDLKKTKDKVANLKEKTVNQSQSSPKMPSSGGYSATEQLHTPRSTTASWENVSPAREAFNPMDYLTEEEKQSLVNMVASRVQIPEAIPPMMETENVEPAYFGEAQQ